MLLQVTEWSNKLETMKHGERFMSYAEWCKKEASRIPDAFVKEDGSRIAVFRNVDWKDRMQTDAYKDIYAIKTTAPDPRIDKDSTTYDYIREFKKIKRSVL